MADWQDFETNATQLLNDTLTQTSLSFQNSGGSNSTDSDIKVLRNSSIIGSIEAKFKKPQCGQITVVYSDGQFSFSENSVNVENEFTTQIIEHLNNNVDIYKNYSTASINITVDEEILSNWVKTYYLEESQWFIYSKNKENLTHNNVLLIPIDELNDYFTVTASFRIKKSGSSSSIADKNNNHVKRLIDEHLNRLSYSIEEDGKKIFIRTDKEIGKTPLKDGYFISAKKDGKFAVTKRNQTENPNPNVMFKLTFKDDFAFKIEEFKEFYL